MTVIDPHHAQSNEPDKSKGGNLMDPKHGNGVAQSRVLYSSMKDPPPCAVSAKGSWITTSEGLEIIDASGGAAVTCIGHCNERVNTAIAQQLGKIAYTFAPFFTSEPLEKLALELSASTHNQLTKCFIVSSGTYYFALMTGFECAANATPRHRVQRGRSETGSPVLSGIAPTSTAANSLHRAQPILSWKYVGLTVSRRTCPAQSPLLAHIINKCVTCIPLLCIQKPEVRRD